MVVESSPQIALAEHQTLLGQAARRFLHHRLAIVGGMILVVIVLGAIFAPIIAPQDPTFIDLAIVRAPPSAQHILGGDLSGRDVWSQVVYGTRTSLEVGFGAVAVFMLIGTAVGLAAGLFGGWVDLVVMRLTEIVLSIPTLLLIIVVVSMIGPSLTSVIAVIGLLGWPGAARIVRGQLLSLREAEFVTAARVVGVRDRHILFGHLLPNVLTPLTVVATFGVANAILLEAALSFLGLGVQPPTPSLGQMINAAQSPTVLRDLPWIWVPPGVVIALTVLAVNFVGDGLRDALDPRSVSR
ncbi:MAG TPA: oligopeptide ABC transporter permease [Candidatus Saccharimonadales bacterium]|nr:oligopeptide ABC transporter permease [Candidatus Saccharimonadales bacterium]